MHQTNSEEMDLIRQLRLTLSKVLFSQVLLRKQNKVNSISTMIYRFKSRIKCRTSVNTYFFLKPFQ